MEDTIKTHLEDIGYSRTEEYFVRQFFSPSNNVSIVRDVTLNDSYLERDPSTILKTMISTVGRLIKSRDRSPSKIRISRNTKAKQTTFHLYY